MTDHVFGRRVEQMEAFARFRQALQHFICGNVDGDSDADAPEFGKQQNVEFYIRRAVMDYPWFDAVVQDNKKKMVLPATVPYLNGEDLLWLEQARVLLGIGAIAAETDAPKLIEATHLSVFVKLAGPGKAGRHCRIVDEGARRSCSAEEGRNAHRLLGATEHGARHYSEIVRQPYP